MTNLPNGWEVKRLDEIAYIVMGQSPPGSSYNEHGEGQPFFQGKTEFGEVHPTVRKYTTAGTKFAKAGDILMSVRAPVGPTNITDINCVIGRGLAAIRAKSVVSQSYLRWSLKHLEIDIQSKGTGTTFDAITGETLRGTLVALPPMAEQHKIVELLEDRLSRLDAALVDVKQAKLKAAQFRRSLLQAAFTGNLRVGGTSLMTELPKGWVRTQMGEIGRYINGKAFKSQDWKSSGRPIIRIQNLTGSSAKFNYFNGEIEDRYVVRTGDLLFSWSATLGTYIWKGPEAVLNQHIFKVESNIDRTFHRYLLDFKIQEMLLQTHGSGMVHITKKSFDAIEVNIPPIDEQHQIVEFLEDHLSRLDISVSMADTMEKQSIGLRRSLLQAAFTGQLTKEVVSV
jgi:restriction endonuclease S subunit